MLCVLFLAVLLPSCGGGGAERETHKADSETEPVTAEETSELTLVEDGRSSYVVIYPENADRELMQAVNDLISSVKQATGVTLADRSDYLSATAEPAAYEILIGSTNRAESAIADDFRTGDYTVAVQGTKLVLCGGSSAATANAVAYFAEQIAGQATGERLQISSSQNYLKTQSYYISSLKINDVCINRYRIVVPRDGYTERYVAQLIVQHLRVYSGYAPQIVEDTEALGDYEIRIGVTNRGEVAPTNGTYEICVTDRCVTAVSDSVFGYLDVLDALQTQVFPKGASAIALSVGQTWSGQTTAPNATKQGSLRILYHNVWGYLNSDGSNPMANRSDIMVGIYAWYLPDVLCLQEAGPYYRTNSDAMMTWLGEHYEEICYSDQGGAGNPIFYRAESLELVESGYEKSRNGDKGTTWAVFRERSSGILFAVTDSHFAADTNAGGDSTLGNEYRVQDAGVVAKVCADLLARYGSVQIFSGGDFNSMQTDDSYAVLLNAGYANVRDLAKAVNEKSPYHGSFSYNAEWGYYPLQSLLPYSGRYAIDHVMTVGTSAEIHCYQILSDRLSLSGSDHAPHYIDITLTAAQ